MSKVNKQLSNNLRDFHKNSDGSYGTDPHDADLLRGLAEVIKAVASVASIFIGAKRK